MFESFLCKFSYIRRIIRTIAKYSDRFVAKRCGTAGNEKDCGRDQTPSEGTGNIGIFVDPFQSHNC